MDGAEARRQRFRAQVAARLRMLTGELAPPVRALAARPGKQLRSTLLYACATAGPGRDAVPDAASRTGRRGPAAGLGQLVRLGALVELVHLASLVHDDIIDRAEHRRAGPAVHVGMGSERAGLAGLSCFALAGKEAADLGGGLPVLISRTMTGLAYGELLDIERAFDTTLALPDYLELVARKTGELFRLACVLGAAAGGGDQARVDALGRFGLDFGVAFQVLDDCLDFGAPDSGKPVGTDHLLGLFGAPTLYALAREPSGALAALLLAPSFTAADMPAVREHVRACGGLAAARALARRRYDRALGHLDAVDPQTRAALLDVAGQAWNAG
jgi:geranylgeranyl pyrophosphate synthase